MSKTAAPLRPALNDVAKALLAAAGVPDQLVRQMDAPTQLSHLNESRFLTEFGVKYLREGEVPEALIQEMQDWLYARNGVAPPPFVPVQPTQLKPPPDPPRDRIAEFHKANPGKKAEYQRAYRARKKAQK